MHDYYHTIAVTGQEFPLVEMFKIFAYLLWIPYPYEKVILSLYSAK